MSTPALDSLTSYTWAENYRFKCDPEDAATVIQKIQAKNDGFCSPHNLIKEAQSPRSPLHDDIFRLDDSEAAYEHRLHIARRMIRGLRVVNSPVQQQFLHVKVTNGDVKEGYVDAVEVAGNANYRMFVLEEAKNMLLSYRRRWGWLQELDRIWQVIDDEIEE